MYPQNEAKNAESPLARIGTADMEAKSAAAAEHERTMRARHTPWKDASIEEKLEKLRMVERDNQRTLGYIARVAREAVDLAKRHQHNPSSGEVLKPANDTGHGDAQACGSIDVLA